MPIDDYAIAILHFDHQQRIQLIARDIEVEEIQLSKSPSTHLHATMISGKMFPYPADSPPRLVPIYPQNTNKGSNETMVFSDDKFLGGVLVVGGTKLLLYELVDQQSQEKERGKRRRLEHKKRSRDPGTKFKAAEKEAERESRIRKSRVNVIWPWSDIAA